MKLSIAAAVAFATVATVGLSATAPSAEAAKLAAAKSYKVAKFDRRAIARNVRRQARANGIRLSPRQVNTAVSQAIGGFKSNGPGVQKIKIRILTKRLDICIATGRHRGQCG
jgi:hypothetical protein